MAEKSEKVEKKILNMLFPYENTWDIGNDHLTFELKNLDLSFVNSVERILLSNIPAVGFNVRPLESSQFKVYKNNSPFENEFITHRIGCIPIHLNADTFDPLEYSFIINKENASKDYLPVTAEDIQVFKLSENRNLTKEQVRKIFPADPLTGGFVPITKIIPWEDKTLDKPVFHCEGRAIVSTASVNASFSNVSVVAHSFKIDPEYYQQKFKEYMKEEFAEHKRINQLLKKTDPEFVEEEMTKTEEEMKKKFDLLEAERCFYRNLDEDPFWFDMIVESVGIHSPLTLVEKGLEIMINKVNMFKGYLENPIDKQLEITKGYNSMDRAYCIRVYNENETLGNLIASHLRKFYIDETQQLSIVGFNRAHPLEKSILIYVNPLKDKTNDWGVIRELIFECCDKIVKITKDLLLELQQTNLYKANISKKSKKNTF